MALTLACTFKSRTDCVYDTTEAFSTYPYRLFLCTLDPSRLLLSSLAQSLLFLDCIFAALPAHSHLCNYPSSLTACSFPPSSTEAFFCLTSPIAACSCLPSSKAACSLHPLSTRAVYVCHPQQQLLVPLLSRSQHSRLLLYSHLPPKTVPVFPRPQRLFLPSFANSLALFSLAH